MIKDGGFDRFQAQMFWVNINENKQFILEDVKTFEYDSLYGLIGELRKPHIFGNIGDSVVFCFSPYFISLRVFKNSERASKMFQDIYDRWKRGLRETRDWLSSMNFLVLDAGQKGFDFDK